jgi:hypothetical protein
MQSRHLIAALAAGDRAQIVRAAALEAAHLASEGGGVSRRENAVYEIAGVHTERGSDTEGQAFASGTRAIGMFLRGRWREAHMHLVNAYEKYPNHRAGWHANAKIFDVYSLFYMGDLVAQSRLARQFLAEAEQRNDLYVIVNLRTTSMVDIALAADDPESARRHIREAMDQWSQSGFLVQHWKAMVWSVETELYVGDGARALAILDEGHRALRRSFLLQVQFLRGMTHFARARALVATAATLPNAERSERLRLATGARALAKKLEREHMPWTDALARFVSAAAANVVGDRDAAIVALEAAIHRATLADMAGFAWVARHQLGVMQGGADGGRRLREAEDALKSREVVFPARYAGVLLPGRWTVGD